MRVNVHLMIDGLVTTVEISSNKPQNSTGLGIARPYSVLQHNNDTSVNKKKAVAYAVLV